MRLLLLFSLCPMWVVASAMRLLTVVMMHNIPVTPAGLNRPPSPARTMETHPATWPAAFHRCCKQIEDMWEEEEEEAEKQTPTDLLSPHGEQLICVF